MIHRASGIGGCLKAQIAAHLGMKPIAPDDASQRRMDEGALHEGDVVARLVEDGWLVERQQDEVVLDFPKGPTWGRDALVVAEGHLDGVITGGFGFSPRVLEIKSMGDTPWKEFQARRWDAGGLIDRYKWQLSVYMLATGYEALFVTKNRNSGEITQHGVELPFYTLDQIAERVAYIEDHVARGDPGLADAHCDPGANTWFCPYRNIFCDKMRANAEEVEGLPSASDEFTPVALLAVEQYAFLGEQIKALEGQRAEQRAVFEAEFERELGTWKKVEAGGYRVQRVTQEIKERVVAASTRQILRVTKIDEKEAL